VVAACVSKVRLDDVDHAARDHPLQQALAILILPRRDLHRAKGLHLQIASAQRPSRAGAGAGGYRFCLGVVPERHRLLEPLVPVLAAELGDFLRGKGRSGGEGRGKLRDGGRRGGP
jgi:hypothetical protein